MTFSTLTSMAFLPAVMLLAAAGSLAFYRQAHRGSYHAWHGLWHLASGAACFCFARGYLAA